MDSAINKQLSVKFREIVTSFTRNVGFPLRKLSITMFFFQIPPNKING